MSIFSSRKSSPETAIAEYTAPAHLEDTPESRMAKEVLCMSRQAAAVVQEANRGVVPDEIVSISINPEAARLGAASLRTEIALHRKSNDPFLVGVNFDEGKGTADIQLI